MKGRRRGSAGFKEGRAEDLGEGAGMEGPRRSQPDSAARRGTREEGDDPDLWVRPGSKGERWCGESRPSAGAGKGPRELGLSGVRGRLAVAGLRRDGPRAQVLGQSAGEGLGRLGRG